MFTGLIQNVGTVRSISKKGDWRIRIQTALDLTKESLGASIACSGVCLTVVEKGDDWFDVEVSGETLSKTTVSNWENGTNINLESSLRMGDELGGHFVFGHVDGMASVESIVKDGDSHRLKIKVPEDLAHYIAPKGSVSLDGISLTVNEVQGDVFGVNIVPHTWAHTTLSQRSVGDALNIEIDMLARYVARQLEKGAA